MDTEIVVAIIGCLGLIISKNLPYITEHFGEKINNFIKIVCTSCVIIGIGFIVLNYKESKNQSQDIPELKTSIESEELKTPIESEQLKTEDEELNKLLAYEPEIKNISTEEFNSANKYRIQMISVETESEAKSFTQLVCSAFPDAKYEQTPNGWYKVVLEEGENKSKKTLDIRNANYNKWVNKILKDNGKGKCDVKTYISNKYIKNEIDKIELLVDRIKSESDTEIKIKCENQIRNIQNSLEQPTFKDVFEGYEAKLDEILSKL